MAVDLSRPEYYINRELSWLDFSRRVLEEARDERNPLLERVRFLGILQVQESGGTSTGPDRLTPEEQLGAISRTTHELVAAQYRCWNEELLPALAAEKIHLGRLPVERLRGVAQSAVPQRAELRVARRCQHQQRLQRHGEGHRHQPGAAVEDQERDGHRHQTSTRPAASACVVEFAAGEYGPDPPP